MVDTTRMTDRSRKVLQIAEKEARRRGATAVFPEHVLLGLLLEGSGVAAHVLHWLDVTVPAMESMFPSHDFKTPDSTEALPCDASVELVVERALKEAKLLNHHYIGTEHLILGVAFEGGNTAASMLDHLSITPEQLHRDVYRLLGHEDELDHSDHDKS